MASQNGHDVAVWTLATEDVRADLPLSIPETAMTPDHLERLREALAVVASCPIVTLEAHPLPRKHTGERVMSLEAASPLAKELSQLIKDSAPRSPAASALQNEGDVLYRAVMPRDLAEQVRRGKAHLMQSRTGQGGVHSAVVGASGIVGQATMMPVPAASGAAVTASPAFIMAALAVGLFVQAELNHADLAARIDDVIVEIREQEIKDRRKRLNGSVDALEKATAALLDRGRIGAALGLDSAAHSISTSIEDAREDVQRWKKSLDTFPDGVATPRELNSAFPGWDEENGELDQRLRLAHLAIGLRRRLILIQAVEQAQADPGNPFIAFVGALRRDERDVDALEQQLSDVVRRLSSLRLCAPKGPKNQVMTRGAVDELLRDSYRLRARGEDVALVSASTAALSIEMVRAADGSLAILPPGHSAA